MPTEDFLCAAAEFYIQSVAWQETKGGDTSKPLESIPLLVKPKNVGRANETTPHDQAVSEIMSKFNGKRDNGYAEVGKESEAKPIYPLPMTALKYIEAKHRLVWPCAMQPKLDGVRGCYDPETGEFSSRGGHAYIPGIVEGFRVPAGI
jgi:hypothetical protein